MTRHPYFFLLPLTLFLVSSTLHAGFRKGRSDDAPVPSSTDAVWSVSAGPAVMVAKKAAILPAYAIRRTLAPNPDTPQLAVELGGAGPVQTPDGFRKDSANANGSDYTAKTERVTEIHLAGVISRALDEKERFSAELGLGVSALLIKSTASRLNAAGAPVEGVTDSRMHLGPLLRVGLSIYPKSRWSGLIDVAWARYANHVSVGGQELDLGVNGAMIRLMVHYRL